MNEFTLYSEKTVNDYIQNIIFVDDKAYSTGRELDRHEFDAQYITSVFSKNKKICAVYKPSVEEDVEVLIQVAKKADVAVLDWQIVLDGELSTSSEGSDEDDEDEDDIRGVYTKRIIHSLVSSPECAHSIKLIVVYTGETDLPGIAEGILSSLGSNGVRDFSICDTDSCSVISNSCRIMVIGKSNGGEDRGKYNPDLAGKIISYDELPRFISKQFTKMTAGLLSNFAMESLTEIRRNFHHIVRKFSKDLDAAYLAHQALLPQSSDANELLVELLGDTFTSMIRYKQLNHAIDKAYIERWLKENIEEKFKPLYKTDGSEDSFEYERTHELLISLLESNPEVITKFISSIGTVKHIQKDDRKDISKGSARTLASKHAITLFTDAENPEEINKRFANLCYHRHAFTHPDYLPRLSLGTVVKSTSEDGSFYVCIQQRCDSVRLDDSEKRRFLFLPLSEVQDATGFNFLTPDGIKLKIDKDTYALRTVKFNGSYGGVLANFCQETGKKCFEPSHFSKDIPERFEFIVELKELYAQRIVEEYSAGLSRVGLDEPEWIRLLS